MGEAKRRQAQCAAGAATLATLRVEELATAVAQVVGATTSFHGADCLLFSAIGAGALRGLGVPAQPVAGSTIWRLGPGDSDTLSHARELAGPLYTPGQSGQALQFHAWIEAPGLLVDFSTCTLRKKAAMLDVADGGSTRVDWAPPYLWLQESFPPERLKTPMAVNQSFDTGVFCYVRHPDIEAVVLPDIAKLMVDLASSAAAAVTAYRALCAGHKLRVIGIGEDASLQTEPAEVELVRHS